MLNHRQTKIQFGSLATLQDIQKQAYQMLMQGLATTGFSMHEWGTKFYCRHFQGCLNPWDDGIFYSY